MVGLEAPQRLFQLLPGRRLGVAVNLGHQEGFLPVALAEGFAHADFALAAVIVPAVVEEVDAVIERAPDDTDAFLLVGLHPEVISAKTDHGHLLARAAEGAHGNGSSFRGVGELLA